MDLEELILRKKDEIDREVESDKEDKKPDNNIEILRGSSSSTKTITT